MADDDVTYTVTVYAAKAERFNAMAREAGMTPEASAAELIKERFFRVAEDRREA